MFRAFARRPRARTLCGVRPGPLTVFLTCAALASLGALWACTDEATPVPEAPPATDARAGDASVDASPPSPEASAPAAHRVTVLAKSTFVNDGRTFPVTFARVDRPDGGRTYVQWVAHDGPGPHGAVLATQPYTGIDWSGEEVDTRWASYPIDHGVQVHPDVDGPGADAGARNAIYEKLTVQEVNQQALLHLLNGLSTLFVFGRFYAGGSVRDEVADMVAGTAFLAEQADVDLANVGVFGGSWGGFEALYASAFADPRVRPKATVAAYPISDFPSWVPHIESRADPAKSALQAHLARVRAGTPGGDFAGLRREDLCARLPKATLLLHDVHDNLVPVAQSRALHDACGAELVLWPRATPLADPGDATHGPLLAEVPSPLVPSWFVYANAYLHERLAPPGVTRVEMVEEATLLVHLGLVRAAQQRGEDVTWILPRLRELIRPAFLDARTKAVSTGPDLVARVVNATWGTSYTGAAIEAALAKGLPPP